MDAPENAELKDTVIIQARRETGGYICGGKGSVDFR